MESVTFTYDGALTSGVCQATIHGAVPGQSYTLVCDDPLSSSATDTAVTSTLVLTVSDVGTMTTPRTFDVDVFKDSTGVVVGTTVFYLGYTPEYAFDAVWDYDGARTVSVQFLTQTGVSYKIDSYDNNSFMGGGTVAGDGTVQTITVTAPSDYVGGFKGVLHRTASTTWYYSDRLFQQGTAGPGVLGNPLVGQQSVIVTLDGVDVTAYAVAGNWTRRLNRPSTAQIRCPMELVNADVGKLLKIEAFVNGLWKIVHHGRVLLAETDTAEDGGYTVYNSTDPMEMWQWRPVRDNDCDFTQPLILQEYTTGPLILEAALNNSIDCGDHSQADCEGDLFLTVNAAAGGGVDLSGAPTDWPMTIAELASLLVSTGEVDVVITPTDPGGGIMGEVDFYNGDYGTDLSATIVFSYGMNAHNVRRLRWNQDMTSMVNKLWYYGGPRIATPADPAAVQHWCWNITGDDPGLVYPPGGANSPPASSTDNQLGVLRVNSKTDYGVRMDIQIFDALDDDCVPGIGTPGRNLYRRRWQQESWLRAVPREIIHVTPTRETEIGTFDIGDLVGVEAVSAVRGGFSGAQRVYEYTVSWDADGVLELSEIQTSADNEGL